MINVSANLTVINGIVSVDAGHALLESSGGSGGSVYISTHVLGKRFCSFCRPA